MLTTMKKLIVFAMIALPALPFLLVGCPDPKPAPPAVCKALTEDQDGPDHCSKSKEDCEKTLSKILADAHRNRCAIPPCKAFSAWVECTLVNQECKIGENEIGLIFETKEHIRCR